MAAEPLWQTMATMMPTADVALSLVPSASPARKEWMERMRSRIYGRIDDFR